MLRSIFGTRNDRLLKKYNKIVAKINLLEPAISALTDAELQQKTQEFKQRYLASESLAEMLPEVFAVCREASQRTLKMRHFDVQLIGGMVLNDGKIAEMTTGEGKTLVATLAVYLNAIAGSGVHVVTVNDYLAKRDAHEMSKLYNFLGLTVGTNLPNMSHEEKQQAYLADITYGTNNEFGFDYLRDNMVFDVADKVQRQLSFAVVDEVDSILIDEARTPLIISGPLEDSEELYIKLDQVPPMLSKQDEEDSGSGEFWVDEKNHNVVLSEAGHEKVEQILLNLKLLKDGDSLYNVQNISLLHHLLAALKAHYVYIKDQHYVIQDGEVVIVDEFTGRLMSGRRWSDGLHQAVEAKENVKIQRENQTLASITFQNYFRMYKKLSGMTGTADTEAFEFQQIYGLETVVIPTNKQMVRVDHNDKIYMNVTDKYNAIIEDIKECTKRGQPVLVGTTSVENSETLSKLLTQAKLKHEVLNAKQHAREAEIILQAGKPGAITVATNMAGRGTDIILGGGVKSLINAVNDDAKLTPEQKEQKISQLLENWRPLNATVLANGGLYIIGTERHESRRIDNQLRGRSGRQGDPGASRFYLSLDDPLLRIFGGERMRGLMQRLGMEAGEAIEHKWLSRSIESAQRKVEGHNFDIRKQLLDYDDVSNDQRRVIYQERDEILANESLADTTISMIEGVVGHVCDTYIPPKSMEEEWDIVGLEKVLKNEYLLECDIAQQLVDNPKIDATAIRDDMMMRAQQTYTQKMANFAAKVNADVQQFARDMIREHTRVEGKVNVAGLDDFCAQNGIVPTESFVSYAASNPNLGAADWLNHFTLVVGDVGLRQVNRFERSILLQNIDHHWREHLTGLEQLRQGIHLRGYAQKDPKQEYKVESFELFSSMLESIKLEASRMLLTVRIQGVDDLPTALRAELKMDNQQQVVHEAAQSLLAAINAAAAVPPASNIQRAEGVAPGRNSACPCGSGKKYKQCHGKL